MSEKILCKFGSSCGRRHLSSHEQMFRHHHNLKDWKENHFTEEKKLTGAGVSLKEKAERQKRQDRQHLLDEKVQSEKIVKFDKLTEKWENETGGPIINTTPRRLLHSTIHQNLRNSTNFPLPLINIIEDYLVCGSDTRRENKTITFSRYDFIESNLSLMLQTFDQIFTLDLKKERNQAKYAILNLVTHFVMMQQERISHFRPMYGDRFVFSREQKDQKDLEFFWTGTSAMNKDEINVLDFPSVYYTLLPSQWESNTHSIIGEGKITLGETKHILSIIDLGDSVRVQSKSQTQIFTINLTRQGYECELIDNTVLTPTLLDPPRPTNPERFFDRYLPVHEEKTKRLLPPPGQNTKIKFPPLSLWRLTKKLENGCKQISVADENFYLVSSNRLRPDKNSFKVVANTNFHGNLHSLFFSPGELERLSCPVGGVQFVFPQFDHENMMEQMFDRLSELATKFNISPHRLLFHSTF
jgi:hypothetical protein